MTHWVERFESYINKTGTCWLWTGQTAGSTARYGVFRIGTKSTDKRHYAHRVAYELYVGKIPRGLELDHVTSRGCTSKLCVNPAHLEPVTHAENRLRSRLEVCRSGKHDLTITENQTFDKYGNRRGCAQCKREKALRYYYKKKEKESKNGSL